MRRRVLVSLGAVLAASALVVGSSIAGASVSAKAKAPLCATKTKKAAVKAIKKSWGTFLNGAGNATLEDKAAVIQGTDDPAFRQLFNDVAARFGALLKTTTVKVTKVTCTGKKAATVNFDLVQVADGTPLLPGQVGDAVFEGGVWKASTRTVCDLLSLADSTLAASPTCMAAT